MLKSEGFTIFQEFIIMSKKCPRCGSKNTHCANRSKQVLEFGVKFTAAATATVVGTLTGHPKIGKWVADHVPTSVQDSVYKCDSCGNVFVP